VALELADVIVVDKPAGIVVHPGAGNVTGTLVAGLLHRFPELALLGEQHRWGLVHRLDKDTSGLLLVARSPEMHEYLQAELQNRRVERTYVALVAGQLEAATGTVDAPIGRDPLQPTRMAIGRSGRPARTHYRRMAAWTEVTLVEVTLETGRTHQIRVHLASIGHGIVGDRVYGRGPDAPGDPGRVWLHATQLRFPLPTGETRKVTAEIPADLRQSLHELGKPALGSIEL
jgi:23S rRNA pseudouridine1911/1915/1917 synthase